MVPTDLVMFDTRQCLDADVVQCVRPRQKQTAEPGKASGVIDPDEEALGTDGIAQFFLSLSHDWSLSDEIDKVVKINNY